VVAWKQTDAPTATPVFPGSGLFQDKFDSNTKYTATITLKAKSGWTFAGLPANNITLDNAGTGTTYGARPAGDSSGQTTVEVLYTATAKTIGSVTAGTYDYAFPIDVPEAGATAQTATTLATEAYTVAISWNPALTSNKFAAGTEYTAVVTLTPKTTPAPGFTLKGFDMSAANTDRKKFFGDGTWDIGAGKEIKSIVAPVAESGAFQIIFNATASNVSGTDLAVGIALPTTGGTPATTITPASPTGYTLTSISWTPTGATFAASTSYTATVVLGAKTGYTFFGMAANSFTVSGATSATFAVDATDPTEGTITVVFPATGS